jgi:protein associated with RNAse G/E
MGQVIVRKLDHTGCEVTSYQAELLECSGDTIVLRTSWNQEALDLRFVRLEPDDCWTEFFFEDRWYNIFEIRASDGRLKGWYCNFTRPALVFEDEVVAEDLALDLWVDPSGRMSVLDADEFAELDLRPGERDAVQQALEELKAMVVKGAPPFDRQ